MKAILLTLAILAQKIIMLFEAELIGGYVGRGKMMPGARSDWVLINDRGLLLGAPREVGIAGGVRGGSGGPGKMWVGGAGSSSDISSARSSKS